MDVRRTVKWALVGAAILITLLGIVSALANLPVVKGCVDHRCPPASTPAGPALPSN